MCAPIEAVGDQRRRPVENQGTNLDWWSLLRACEANASWVNKVRRAKSADCNRAEFWTKTFLFLLIGGLGMMIDRGWRHLSQRHQMWGSRGEQEGKKQKGNKFRQVMEERGTRAEGRDGGNLKKTSHGGAHACFLYRLISCFPPCPEEKRNSKAWMATHQIPIQSDLYGILRGSEGKLE